jgi:endonuclease/exonuclease/phosphatase family metal-dependent hydrolase
MQGTYIFAPDGALLARKNSNSAAVVSGMMKEALLQMERRFSSDELTVWDVPQARGRWEDNYPATGLVLRRWVRDLPSAMDPSEAPAKRFNRDALWFSREEMQAWLPEAREPGHRHRLPSALAERMARLSLVDNARGQTLPFAPAEIRKARIEISVVDFIGATLRLRIDGETEAVAPGPWLLGETDWRHDGPWPRSLRTRLCGTATFNCLAQRFTQFEVLALGQREGRSVNNGRGRDPRPGPIGFVLELAPPEWKIAPTYADLYDVTWMRHPESTRRVSEDSFTLIARFRVSASSPELPLLVSDKDWPSGKVRDYTDHHHLGRSRTSGNQRGFALALRENGAWTFNLGDGRRRVDYLAPARSQGVTDGGLHRIVSTVDRDRNELRLHRNGELVAIYSLAGLGRVRPPNPVLRLGPGVESAEVLTRVLSAREIAALEGDGKANDATGAQSKPVVLGEGKPLKLLAWNIWHGGRRDGNALGLKKTVDVIRESGADIICMQETYGSGPEIAAALGFQLYLRSSNISVMSRFPIVETHDLFEPFRLGGVTVDLGSGRRLKVFSLWINSRPDVGQAMRADEVSVASLLEAEQKTRGREMERALHTLEPHLRPHATTPVIVAGDFNSASHLDWTAATASRHRGLVVDWPVSRSMFRYGFADAFRLIHPDPEAVPARTWSPRFTEAYPLRIDQVYFRGDSLRPLRAQMLDRHPEGWPSDHAAVLIDFSVDAGSQ